jgi:hypothetical protein
VLIVGPTVVNGGMWLEDHGSGGFRCGAGSRIEPTTYR